MPRSILHLAVVSAGLILAPTMTSLSIAADEPAVQPRERAPSDRPERPDGNRSREGRPGEARPGEARPGEGRRGEARPGEARPGAEGRGGRIDPNAMLERLQTVLAELDLTPEQKTKVDEAIATAKKTMSEQKEAEPRERMQAAQTALVDLRRSIEATLNEEQKKTFAEKLPVRGPGRPGDGAPGEGRPGTDGRGAAMTNALNAALEKVELTAEQKAKVREAFMAEMQKMRDGEARPAGGRPEGDRPGGARPSRPDGDRPQGERPQGDRPQGERPANRPQGERPANPQPDRQ